MKNYKLIIIPIIVTLFFSCSSNVKNKKRPLAKNGILDLRNWDLKVDGPVKLDGEWNFFWKKFIPPENINKESKVSQINTPKVWTSQKINNKHLNRHGYATYHLKILLNPIDTPLAIKFPTVGCAYETYINGKKISQVGKVGKSFETMVPAYRPEVVDFFDINNELDIVIYVSSFHQKFSGLWYSLHFGQSRDLVEIREGNLNRTLFLNGVFIIMFLYHMGLLILRPNEKLPLYFALSCIFLAIRNSTVGEITILNVFPDMSLNWIKTIEFLTFYLTLSSISAFIYKLFPDESSKKIFWIFNTPMIILDIITISTPTKFFTFLMIIAQGIFALTFIYIIYINIFAIIRKREGAVILFIGLFTAFSFSANDVLYALYIINTGYLASYGLLILIFSQSYILSAKFSKAFFSVEKLTSTLETKNVELQDLNLNLENKVEERTEELVAANDEMSALNESLMETRDELQAANAEASAINENLIETRDQLWGEMKLARKMQTVLLPEKPFIEGYEIVPYMKPADDVGGDYYDVINCEGYDWIIIGDVSGHGFSAGLIMMMVQTAIHTSLERHPDDKPSRLLTSINGAIKKNLEKLDEDKYMTITVFAALKDGKFIYSGLHQDLMIYREKTKKVEIMETEGFWIGILDDIDEYLNDCKLNINIGDILLLYTDGITEAWKIGSIPGQRDPESDMYSDEKLIQTFQENAVGNDLKGIQSQILKSLDDYEYDDDITLLLIKRVE